MSDWEISDDDWSERKGAGPGTRPSVLIVDDDPTIRAMLGFLFDDEGFEVREAVDGAAALEALADPPDAMVLDLMMPRVDGHGVLRARRQDGLAPDTRVVILTAKSSPEDAVWCWELGADEYVNKPVDPERLLREVQMLLKRTPEEIRARREEGLAEARRLDAMEAAFDGKKKRR